MSYKSWYWWLALTITSFGLLESIALKQPHPRPTLSRVLRMNIRKHKTRSALFTMFLIWFIYHIILEDD